VLEIFDQNVGWLKENVEAASVSDETTKATIREVYAQFEYILDPHSAVAYRALADYLKTDPGQKGIFLETAHPIKFDSVAKILGTRPKAPKSVEALFSKEKMSVEIEANYADLKEILISKI